MIVESHLTLDRPVLVFDGRLLVGADQVVVFRRAVEQDVRARLRHAGAAFFLSTPTPGATEVSGHQGERLSSGSSDFRVGLSRTTPDE